MAVLQITSVLQESQTWDEAVYIASGYTYWTTGDFRLNPEHPPLAKLLVALPLLFAHVEAPLQSAAWKNTDQYAFGADFLYKNRISADSILFASRCATIVVTLLFGLVVALWTKRRAGTLCALVALALFVFDPNIVAHGRYATNDLYLAFFYFLGAVLWNRALRRGAVLDYVAAGLALGLACCTNISGLLLVPVFALLCIGRVRGTRALALGSLVAIACGIAVTALLYRGELYHYRDAVSLTLQHARGGQLTYLFGSTFRHSVWYFYPAVAAVKTPVGIFLLAILIGATLLRRKALTPDSGVVLIAAAVYAVACLVSPIDFGIRILLPVYPLLYVFFALNLPRGKPARWAIALCVALVVAESAAIYPNYLAFFNVLAGGPAQGPRYLLDSNIDWGQDTKRLKAYMQARDIPDVCTAYFGLAYPFYYGIAQRTWVGYVNASNRNTLDCVLAISVTWLYGGPEIAGPTWGWLRSQPPDARIGDSIYVYDFRTRRASRTPSH